MLAERWAGFILSLQSVEEMSSRSVPRLCDTLKNEARSVSPSPGEKPSDGGGGTVMRWPPLPDGHVLMFSLASSEKGQGNRLSLTLSFLYEGNMFP